MKVLLFLFVALSTSSIYWFSDYLISENNFPEKETIDLKDHPNIIYILADDLGIGDLSCYNPDGKIPTPHLDQLAAGGIRFTDAHTSSSVCTPTRYGIITGRYNWRSPLKKGVLTGKSNALIEKDRGTIASMLKNQGYYNGFIGKWHLGWNWGTKSEVDTTGEGWDAKDFENLDFTKEITHTPNDLGFDYAYGHSGSLDMAPYVYVENGKCTALPDTVTVNKGKYSWWREGPTGSDFDHEEVTPNFFNRSIQFIKEHEKSSKPYFLYLALPSPHTPILPSEKWQGKSGMNPYADFVMMIDEYIGQISEAVGSTEEGSNTIVIFTSDNGVSPASKLKELEDAGHYSSGIYRGHKADIFEGGHRVPFILSWPAQVDPGRTSDKIICTTDFFATAAEITNYDIPDDEAVDSYSFLAEIKGKDAVSEQRSSIIHHSINGSFAIREGDWKLILCGGSGGWSAPKPNSKKLASLPKFQLYNLENDPSENENLYEDNPKIAERLHQSLLDIIDNGRSTNGKTQSNEEGKNGWPELAKIK